MSGIFPVVQPEAAEHKETLPLCREAAWDFAQGKPLFSGGQPLTVTGAEAVKVWAWKCLKTSRFRHAIYTWDYGSEAETLIGKPFTSQVKESEAERLVREALSTNPYITGIGDVSVSFSGTELTVTCQLKTIYGEVEVNV